MSGHAEELQQRWRAVAKHFSIWTILPDLFFDPTSYSLWGENVLNGVLKGNRSRAAAAELAGASQEELAALSEMAKINVSRSGDVFRNVAVVYISLPIAFLALLSEAAPDQVRATFTQVAPVLGNIIFALVISPIVYWVGHWRAKQISWTIDIFRTGALSPAKPKKR